MFPVPWVEPKPVPVIVTCFATVNAAAGTGTPPFDGRLYTTLFAPDQARLDALDAATLAALAPLNTGLEK